MDDEFGLVALVYALNLLFAFIVMLALSAAIGRHDPSQRLLSVANAALPMACASVLAFLATYFASLNWTRSEELRQKAVKHARWLLIIPSIGLSLFSIGLTVGLFFIFDFGTVLGSFGANVMLLQCLFALRAAWAT